jgi:hypothetical protein
MTELGNLRFPAGVEFEKATYSKMTPAVQRMLNNLADNYPSVPGTKISQLYLAFCEEREKALSSSKLIADDQFYSLTRPEFLFQILGDLLFINEKTGGVEYTDITYRDFLLKVKTAYFGGSTISNINKSLSSILGVPVTIREMYLDARRVGAVASIKDTHRMLADILMGDEGNTIVGNVSTYIKDLYYFIDLIRPSHSLFETRLIWKDGYSIAGCASEDLTQDPNGNSYEYILSPLANPVYSLYRLAIGSSQELTGFISSNWVEGTVGSVDLDAGVITLTNGTELVLFTLSVAYKHQVDGIHHIDMADVSIGDHVYLLGKQAQGSFNFHEGATPSEVLANPYAQFDPFIIASSAFQANVQRMRGTNGRALQNKACSENLMDDAVGTVLLPMYEDLRDNCEYPTAAPYSEEFSIPSSTPIPNGSGFHNLTSVLSISDVGNQVKISRVPLVASNGTMATASDIKVYLNGAVVHGGVSSVDPWAGLITFTFLPPAGAKVRVDYFYHAVYPSLLEQVFEIPSTTSSSGPGLFNLGAYAAVASDTHPVVKFQWPFRPKDLSLYGNSMSYQVNLYPILNRDGDLALPSDVSVFVDGVEIPGSVVFVRALLGHVQLNFIPPIGSSLSIQYYYQSKKRSYAFISDSDQHLSDTVYGVNSPYTLESDPEPYEGPFNNLDKFRKPAEYSYKFRAFDLSQSSVVSCNNTGVIGEFQKPAVNGSWAGTQSKLSRYKVHFSGEYLKDKSKYIELNDDYLKNSLEAINILRKGVPPFFRSFTSFADYVFRMQVQDPGQVSTIAGFNLPAQASVENMPSGMVEFIPVDKVQEKGRIKLYSGLKEEVTVDGDETIQLSSICEERGFGLSVGFSEEYYPNRELRLNDYKDFILREEIPSSYGRISATQGSAQITAGLNIDLANFQKGSTLSVSYLGVITEYILKELVYQDLPGSEGSMFENPKGILDRAFEQPTGNYDVEMRIPFYGKMYTIKGSDIVKSGSPKVNWRNCRVGSVLSITWDFGGGSREIEYTLMEVINSTTARLDKAFFLPGGLYEFTLRQQFIKRLDVLMNEVVRRKTLDLNSLFPSYASGFSTSLETSFADPDPDPYPRNAGGTPVGPPPLLTSQVDDDGGMVQFHETEAQADKMVKFRNWDQDMMVVFPGIMEETFDEPMDDSSDGAILQFWDVSQQKIVEYTFRGLILITSEALGWVRVADFPRGLIRLSGPDDTENLNNESYLVARMIVRQVLPDNTVELAVIPEFTRATTGMKLDGLRSLDDSWHLDAI